MASGKINFNLDSILNASIDVGTPIAASKISASNKAAWVLLGYDLGNRRQVIASQKILHAQWDVQTSPMYQPAYGPAPSYDMYSVTFPTSVNYHLGIDLVKFKIAEGETWTEALAPIPQPGEDGW